ncbi:MAG: hypothetical protein OYL41_00465 [Acidobacteriota bacterium]|nr:hypothetical protein [Acidobacteriota bacterium]
MAGLELRLSKAGLRRRFPRLLPVLVGAALVTEPVGAYRFFGWNLVDQVTSLGAAKWADESLPLRFRSVENDAFPAILPEEAWREGVRRGFAAWEDVPTSRMEILLEEGTVSADGWRDRNGINTIGFVAPEEGFNAAVANLFIKDGVIVECDITVGAIRWNQLAEGTAREELVRRARAMTLHEVGHCLGLTHSAANPVWRVWPDAPSEWTPSVTGGDAPEDVRTFFPNSKMAYANSYGYPGLHPDDITGVSLLYPAAGFLEGAGTIRGRIVFADGSPASFAVVSSAEGGAPGSPFGPHTFTDAHGQFVLEGLRPGRTMLWIHPYLVPAGKAFSNTDVATPAMHHTMLWPLVEAGRTLDLGEIRVTRDDGDAP